MKKKNRSKKKKPKITPIVESSENSLALHTEIADLKETVKKLIEYREKSEENFQDLEIHVNLLTRLLTTLCVEKFGMRVGVLKRFIKRVETEAIRDSQILHLETLYKLPHQPQKKNSPPPASSGGDPWDQIS